MPRNNSGQYTPPAGNPVITETLITSTWANSLVSDMGAEVTASLDRSGRGGMLAALKLIDGAEATPALRFTSEASLGMYRAAAGVLGFTTGGVERFRLNDSGGSIVGGLAVSVDLTVAGDAVVETDLAVGGNAEIVGSLQVAGSASFATGRVIPHGGIIMWSGSVADIEPGWQLCDGTNGTPDLRDKFVIGARQDDAGVAKTNITGSLTQSGGSKDAVVVSHTHPFAGTTASQSANHTHAITVTATGLTGNIYYGESGPAAADGIFSGFSYQTNFGGGGAYNGYRGIAINATHNHSASAGLESANHQHGYSGTTNSTGESGTNKNLPPYYALAFIQCMAPPAP